MLMIKTKLRQLREELTNPGVSQEAMARRVGLSLVWYRRLENGQAQRTSFTSANALLSAFNAERQQRGLEPLMLEYLELTIV